MSRFNKIQSHYVIAKAKSKKPKAKAKPKKPTPKVSSTEFDDYFKFAKKVGIISDPKVLKKIGAPNGYEDNGAWSADYSSAASLSKFVKANPKYHVVTETSDSDGMEEDETHYITTMDNCMRTVNRMSYYLADGDANEMLTLCEMEPRQ